MAMRYTAHDVLDNLFDDDIGVSEGEESDFEGEGIWLELQIKIWTRSSSKMILKKTNLARYLAREKTT